MLSYGPPKREEEIIDEKKVRVVPPLTGGPPPKGIETIRFDDNSGVKWQDQMLRNVGITFIGVGVAAGVRGVLEGIMATTGEKNWRARRTLIVDAMGVNAHQSAAKWAGLVLSYNMVSLVWGIVFAPTSVLEKRMASGFTIGALYKSSGGIKVMSGYGLLGAAVGFCVHVYQVSKVN